MLRTLVLETHLARRKQQQLKPDASESKTGASTWKTRLETLSAALPSPFVVITVVFHSAERLGSFTLAEEAKSQSASTLCFVVCVFVCMDSFLEDCVVCVLRITAAVFFFILSLPRPSSHVHLSPKSRIIFIFSLISVVLLSKY